MLASEGQCVTLPTNLKERHDEDIEWVYNDICLIAKLHGVEHKTIDCDDGRFKDRLQLDIKTGALTIKSISKIQSGLYEPKITDESLKNRPCQSYNVTVYGESE